MKLKAWLSKKSNLFTLVILAFVIWRQFPVVMKNFEHEGVIIKSSAYPEISSSENKAVIFPPANGKAMAIFWATWCGPCKLEMNRLRTSVENGKIKTSQIFAINPFENAGVVKDFLKHNSFPFVFIEAPDIVKSLQVEVTPTTLLIENGKIHKRSSGVSVTGIWSAEWFLN